jgi:arylsulfatase A-like enzyme
MNPTTILRVITALLFFAPLSASVKPNILFIFADDLGWKDVGYQGADFMETPRIDALAKSGMIFSNGYAPAANCQPSRACLFSGQYTPRHDVYAVNTTNRGPKEHMRLMPVPNKSGIPAKEFAMPDAMKAAEYATGIFGKWHLGGADGCNPKEQGFDVYYDSAKGGNPNASKGKIQSDPKGIFSMSEQAAKFMEENAKAKKPFFLFMSHHAIHTTLQAKKETLAHFEAKVAAGAKGDPLYAACAKDLDSGVGLLLDKLDELGIAENTIVVFTSDNGGTRGSSQEPLRGNKGCYYEGGIREPFIVRWPGVTKPGSVNATPVLNIDLFPTFADAAGAKIPAEKILDGESLQALCRGEKLKRESVFWHFPGYLDEAVSRGRELDVRTGFRTRPVSVIRKGEWKLHLYHEEWLLDGGREKLATNNATELYHLSEDIGEHKNLANTNTAKRDELLDELLAWCKATNAKFPTVLDGVSKPRIKVKKNAN